MTDLKPDVGAPALEAAGLGKRYRRAWALRDCSFRLPAGRVCALVGPNGAGKSTLLSLAAGLLAPSEGGLRVFGRSPGEPGARGRVAFVAQEKPLYGGFTVAETLRLGRDLNPDWDAARAEEIVADGGLAPSARIGALSGGQRTRVCLALAVGKRADLLVLDEPMSDLDPLARRQLMGVLMAEAAEHGTTVLMSSHVIAEIEEACDYLVLLSGGRALLAGDIEEIVAAHRLVVGRGVPGSGVVRSGVEDGGVEDRAAEGGRPAWPAPHEVVDSRLNGRQLTALVRSVGPVPESWETSVPNLEEIVLAHLRSPDATPLLTGEARPAATAVAA